MVLISKVEFNKTQISGTNYIVSKLLCSCDNKTKLNKYIYEKSIGSVMNNA